jgi:integrase
MFWHAARVDDYTPPFVRGMARQSTKHQARARVLSDAEIRAVWRAAEDAGTFGAIVRIALLTGARSRKVASMRWSDISDQGEWTPRREPREKAVADLMLAPVALEIIRAQTKVDGNEFVFAASRGSGPFGDWWFAKRRLDAKLPGIKPWVIHDLRRTHRSLLSRIRVDREVAESVLGHSIPGVEGTYDRHEYREEKRDAQARFAGLIDSIINAPPANVVSITERVVRRAVNTASGKRGG